MCPILIMDQVNRSNVLDGRQTPCGMLTLRFWSGLKFHIDTLVTLASTVFYDLHITQDIRYVSCVNYPSPLDGHPRSYKLGGDQKLGESTSRPIYQFTSSFHACDAYKSDLYRVFRLTSRVIINNTLIRGTHLGYLGGRLGSNTRLLNSRVASKAW